jgi:hypothetical protein
MLFEIAAPVFRCADDENIFLSRLCELPGYDKVIVKGRNLHLQISANPDETLIAQLQEICNFWHTTFKPVSE